MCWYISILMDWHCSRLDSSPHSDWLFQLTAILHSLGFWNNRFNTGDSSSHWSGRCTVDTTKFMPGKKCSNSVNRCHVEDKESSLVLFEIYIKVFCNLSMMTPHFNKTCFVIKKILRVETLTIFYLQKGLEYEVLISILLYQY